MSLIVKDPTAIGNPLPAHTVNAISFSLYGENPTYCKGAVANAWLAKKYYPGWMVVVWYGPDVPKEVVHELVCKSPAVVRRIPEWCPPMMSRLLAADLPTVGRFLVRDADSRLSQREADCVKAWIESDKIAHYIVDHPGQRIPPGGLSGFQWKRENWQAPKMEGLIRNFLTANEGKGTSDYGFDELFMAKVLWPMFSQSYLLHDALQRKEVNGQPFPTPRTDWPRFCGEVVLVNQEGNESFRNHDWESTPK